MYPDYKCRSRQKLNEKKLHNSNPINTRVRVKKLKGVQASHPNEQLHKDRRIDAKKIKNYSQYIYIYR